MQFRLQFLFILTALFCVYLGVLNLPTAIAGLLFGAAVIVSPAYWVAGVIYARDARRAFFIGAIASGFLPYLFLVYNARFPEGNMWGFGYQRYQFGETQAINVLVSLFIFSPLVFAYVGGWIAVATYHNMTAAPSDGAQSPLPTRRRHPLDRDPDLTRE